MTNKKPAIRFGISDEYRGKLTEIAEYLIDELYDLSFTRTEDHLDSFTVVNTSAAIRNLDAVVRGQL